MSLTVGDVIDPRTTLMTLIDQVYQRTATLTEVVNPQIEGGDPLPSYTINVIGPNFLLVQWPDTAAQIEIGFAPRSVYPDLITL